MKKEVKDKWVEALRSGEYTQGLQMLHDADSNAYCCLGVLCHIHSLISEIKWYKDTYYMGENLILPEKVKYWADLHSLDPLVEYAGGSYALSTLNDRRVTFEQIADLIEEQL